MSSSHFAPSSHSLRDELRALFAAEAAHFFTGVFRSDVGELQLALDGEIEPFLGARLELEAHASCKAQCAHKTHRLIGEAVDGKRKRTSPCSMSGKAIRGIEQQAARSGIKSEIAIAFNEKSRRRKSSMMVDQRSSGRVPGRT